MVATKDIATVTEKWQRKVAAAGPDYITGVNNPKADWGTETLKAGGRYAQGVTQGIANKQFEKGVAKAGTEKWKKGATGKGADRWPTGVAAAVDEYQQGMGEVLNTIQGVTLPPRGPKGDPANYARVQAIGTALHNKFKGR